MKKVLTLATAALLVAGVAVAATQQDKEKGKKKSCAKGKSCCKKSKSCDKKDATTAEVK